MKKIQNKAKWIIRFNTIWCYRVIVTQNSIAIVTTRWLKKKLHITNIIQALLSTSIWCSTVNMYTVCMYVIPRVLFFQLYCPAAVVLWYRFFVLLQCYFGILLSGWKAKPSWKNGMSVVTDWINSTGSTCTTRRKNWYNGRTVSQVGGAR